MNNDEGNTRVPNCNSAPTEGYEKIIELEHALDYVSKHFIYHAEQRIRTLRYFMVYLGVIVVGFYNIHNAGDFGTLASVTALSFVITIIFGLLEWRNNELVSHAKSACISLESILMQELKKNLASSKIPNLSELLSTIQVVKISDKKKSKLNKLISYRVCLSVFYVVVLIAHTLLFIFSIYCLCSGGCNT